MVVQSEGCAPIVRAYDRGERFAEPWQNAQTIAAGLRVPAAIGDYLILDAVRVPAENRIADEGDGLRVALSTLARSRPGSSRPAPAPAKAGNGQ